MKLPSELMGLFRTVMGLDTSTLSGNNPDLSDRVDLLSLLTNACEAMGDTHGAREAARHWVQVVPLDAYAHYKLAVIEQRLCNYREAVQRLEVAMRLSEFDNEIQTAIQDALQVLDAIQMQQITALIEMDAKFRLDCLRNPQFVLMARGFMVSNNTLRRIMDLCRNPHMLENATLPPTTLT